MSDRSKTPTFSDSGCLSLSLPITEKEEEETQITATATDTRKGSTSTFIINVPTLQQENTTVTAPSATDTRKLRSASPSGLPSELEFKLMTQMSRYQLLEELCAQLHQSHEPVTAATINEHLQTVDDIHKAFLKEHAYFESTWPKEHLTHKYWTEKIFFNESILFSRIKCKLSTLRQPTPVIQPPTESSIGDHSGSSVSNKLPELTLPIFKGDIKDWPAFRELFNILILKNRMLTDVRKLQYLRGYVQGSAAQLINSLPLEAGSLKASMDLLTERYENHRALIQAHLDKLTTMKPLTSPSANRLLQLSDQIIEAYNSLSTLNINDNLGECLIVSLAVQCLDRATRKAWETSTRASIEYPTLRVFLKFISNHAQGSNSVEGVNNRSTNSNSSRTGTLKSSRDKQTRFSYNATAARAATSITSTHASAKSHVCDYCHENHYIASCPDFLYLDVDARKKEVILNRLCFNCLGRHSSRDCKTNNSCKTCGVRHHTLLHGSKYMENLPPRTAEKRPSQPSTAAGTSKRFNRQIHYTSTNERTS